MYRTPSSRKKNKQQTRLNLIPILDSVFIFIFFLLMSANFIQLFEITSDIPIISDESPPPSEKDPLALTVKIDNKGFRVYTGTPNKMVKKIEKLEKQYNNEELHTFLIGLKKEYVHEDQVVIEPLVDIEYGEIIKIMDAIRLLRDSDETIYKKDKSGLTTPVKTLFNNIIFGNTY